MSLPPARVFFIVARAANKAVVFRRGPSKWVQLIQWNLDNDTFECGQWVEKKIRPRRCDLSPSGKYLIYLVDNFEHMPSRTVVSRPPYWTAIAAWEHEGALYGSGGGLFHNESEVALNGIVDAVPHKNWPIPSRITITTVTPGKPYNLWKGQINTLLSHRMERDGWKLRIDDAFVATETLEDAARRVDDGWAEAFPESKQPIVPELWEKPITNSTSLLLISFYHSEHGKNVNKFYISKKNKRTMLEGVEWADTDHKGRVLATKNGQLYASKTYKDGSIGYSELELLVDLNSNKPTRVITPDEMKGWN